MLLSVVKMWGKAGKGSEFGARVTILGVYLSKRETSDAGRLTLGQRQKTCSLQSVCRPTSSV